MEFGEVVTVSSRAFWDDYENTSVLPPQPDLEWQWLANKDETTTQLDGVSTVLMLEGVNVLHFVDQTILKGKVAVCTLQPPHKVSVYHIAEHQLAIVVSEVVDLNLFGHIAELLQPFVGGAKQQVVTINFQASVMHKGTSDADRDRCCFIRGINSKVADIADLAVPNILTGVTAGDAILNTVASWRKFMKLPFASYVVYMDMPDFDNASAAPILELIDAIGVPCDSTFKSRISSVNESNLYT